MNIGRAMKGIREELGIPQKQMAEELAITRTALWKIESGKTMPKWKTISKFIATTHIPVAYLYSRAMDLEDYICP